MRRVFDELRDRNALFGSGFIFSSPGTLNKVDLLCAYKEGRRIVPYFPLPFTTSECFSQRHLPSASLQ